MTVSNKKLENYMRFESVYGHTRRECVLPQGMSWPDVIEEFVYFLRGCGYIIDDDWASQFWTPADDEPAPVNTQEI